MNRRNFLRAMGVAVVIPALPTSAAPNATSGYKLCGVTSGRMSAKGVNFQTMPKSIIIIDDPLSPRELDTIERQRQRHLGKWYNFAFNYGTSEIKLKDSILKTMDYKVIETEIYARYQNVKELRKLRKSRMLLQGHN